MGLALALAATGAQAQSTDALGGQVDRLLEISRVQTLLAGSGAQVWARVSEVASGLPPEDETRILEAVREEFTLALLYQDVRSVLAEEATEEVLAEVLEHLTSGASGEVQRIADTHEPALSMDAFSDRVQTDPPPRERLDLMLRWTEAQGAADLYLLLGESTRSAAHTILDAGLDAGVPLEPRPDAELLAQRETLFAGAFLSFLRQMETVPDSLMAASEAEYRSEAGQWFVDTYALAVGVAIRRAGVRSAERLRSVTGAGVE